VLGTLGAPQAADPSEQAVTVGRGDQVTLVFVGQGEHELGVLIHLRVSLSGVSL
jgi:hypothetical protein